MKKGYCGHIEKETEENTDYRRVLYTGEHSQLVVMSLPVGEEIGSEVHTVDQFFRFETGTGRVVINESTYEIMAGDAVVIPAGSTHNVINTGEVPLKLYTLYAPANHKDKIIHRTKADETEEHFDGVTTESD